MPAGSAVSMRSSLLSVALALAVGVAGVADARAAVCVNRFLHRSEGPKQIITFLTGRLTFQEAQALSAAINKRESPPVEWVDEKGKTIARQVGELRVVRPMPVGCDGKASGVIFVATFMTLKPPAKKISVKLDSTTTVTFDQQVDQ